MSLTIMYYYALPITTNKTMKCTLKHCLQKDPGITEFSRRNFFLTESLICLYYKCITKLHNLGEVKPHEWFVLGDCIGNFKRILWEPEVGSNLLQLHLLKSISLINYIVRVVLKKFTFYLNLSIFVKNKTLLFFHYIILHYIPTLHLLLPLFIFHGLCMTNLFCFSRREFHQPL